MGIKYEMKTEKPEKMGNKEAQELKNIVLAPYMQLATGLIGKARHAGGNMFRHQMDTLAILIDYGYIDSVLLKASVVHDTVEDIKDFDRNLILNADDEGEEVLNLVLEVTRGENETKKEFIQLLKDYRQLVNKKHSDIEAYNQIKSKLNLYKQLGDTNRIKWTKEYLAKYPPVFTAEELL